MIDARELRIGNIVYFNNYKQLDINQIKTLTFIDFEQICYDKHANRFSPIQITTEILEKWFGFEKIDFDYFELKAEKNYYCHIDELGFGFALEHETFYICEYVHELQNLYFALTGEELKVNYEKNI